MLKSIVRALLKVLFRVRVEGDTNHFSQPRLLIIANHQSFLDGLILGAFLPIDPVFQSVSDDAARQRMVSALDLEHGIEEVALGYRFDIVLRGPQSPAGV